MKYKIVVKYLVPQKREKHLQVRYIKELETISFNEMGGTIFTDKESVDRILLELFTNRIKYEHLVEGSPYLNVRVIQGNEFGILGDMISIKFETEK